MRRIPFAMQCSTTPFSRLASCQTLSSTWTAAISVIRRASSICPTLTLLRPTASIRPSRLSASSARTLVANGVRGSGTWSWYSWIRSTASARRLDSQAARR
jgi:hypothetical protein